MSGEEQVIGQEEPGAGLPRTNPPADFVADRIKAVRRRSAHEEEERASRERAFWNDPDRLLA